jgi:hypothetical protein
MYQYILVFISIYNFIQVLRGWDVQDTIMVQPYPYIIADDIYNVPFADCLYACPQQFFKCHLSSESYWLTVT